MKPRTVIKSFFAGSAFLIAFMGFYITSKSQKVANETVNTSMVSVGFQSQAYCNEARYKGETNDGKCTGSVGDPASRCTSTASGAACIIE
jgi:hypothetical protein